MSNSLSNNAVELPVRDGSAPKPNVIEASSTKDISQPTSKDESIMVREPLSNLKNSLIVFIFETLNSAAYYVSLSIGESLSFSSLFYCFVVVQRLLFYCLNRFVEIPVMGFVHYSSDARCVNLFFN